MLKYLLPVWLLFGTGCSSFHGKWKEAVRQPIPTNDIAGPWEGRWISERNAHTGKLRCVMTAKGDGNYDAHFRATFWKIFRAAYEVPLAATNTSNGKLAFTGQSDLGKLAGGSYTYEGSATPERFESSYRSRYDHGRFEMKRPR